MWENNKTFFLWWRGLEAPEIIYPSIFPILIFWLFSISSVHKILKHVDPLKQLYCPLWAIPKDWPYNLEGKRTGGPVMSAGG